MFIVNFKCVESFMVVCVFCWFEEFEGVIFEVIEECVSVVDGDWFFFIGEIVYLFFDECFCYGGDIGDFFV